MPRTKQTAKKSTGERAPPLRLLLDPSVVAFPVPEADEEPVEVKKDPSIVAFPADEELVKVKKRKKTTDIQDLVLFPPPSLFRFAYSRL